MATKTKKPAAKKSPKRAPKAKKPAGVTVPVSLFTLGAYAVVGLGMYAWYQKERADQLQKKVTERLVQTSKDTLTADKPVAAPKAVSINGAKV